MRSITWDVFDVGSLGDGRMEDGGRFGRSGRSETDGTMLNTTDEAPGSSSNSWGDMMSTVMNYKQIKRHTGQLLGFGVPKILKILQASPISPRSPLNNESRFHWAPGYPIRKYLGTMNGTSGITSGMSSCSMSSSSSPSSSSPESRKAVKNSAKTAPRDQRSIATWS